MVLGGALIKGFCLLIIPGSIWQKIKLAPQEIVWMIDPTCVMLGPLKGGSEPCAISNCTERSLASRHRGPWSAWTWM